MDERMAQVVEQLRTWHRLQRKQRREGSFADPKLATEVILAHKRLIELCDTVWPEPVKPIAPPRTLAEVKRGLGKLKVAKPDLKSYGREVQALKVKDGGGG